MIVLECGCSCADQRQLLGSCDREGAADDSQASCMHRHRWALVSFSGGDGYVSFLASFDLLALLLPKPLVKAW